MVAAFNALWRENFLPYSGSAAESLLKSQFCNFAQLTQESGERWPVFWFLEREEKDSEFLVLVHHSQFQKNTRIQ